MHQYLYIMFHLLYTHQMIRFTDVLIPAGPQPAASAPGSRGPAQEPTTSASVSVRSLSFIVNSPGDPVH